MTSRLRWATRYVSQACSDKWEINPTLEQIAQLPQELGQPQALLADNGY